MQISAVVRGERVSKVSKGFGDAPWAHRLTLTLGYTAATSQYATDERSLQGSDPTTS